MLRGWLWRLTLLRCRHGAVHWVLFHFSCKMEVWYLQESMLVFLVDRETKYRTWALEQIENFHLVIHFWLAAMPFPNPYLINNTLISFCSYLWVLLFHLPSPSTLKILQEVPLVSITKNQLRWKGERVAHIKFSFYHTWSVLCQFIWYIISHNIYSESLTGASTMHSGYFCMWIKNPKPRSMSYRSCLDKISFIQHKLSLTLTILERTLACERVLRYDAFEWKMLVEIKKHFTLPWWWSES